MNPYDIAEFIGQDVVIAYDDGKDEAPLAIRCRLGGIGHSERIGIVTQIWFWAATPSARVLRLEPHLILEIERVA